MFYALWLLLISVTQACVSPHISANHRLLPDDVSQSRIDHITRIFRPNIALYVFAIVLALVLPQIAAVLCLIIAAVGFIRTT